MNINIILHDAVKDPPKKSQDVCIIIMYDNHVLQIARAPYSARHNLYNVMDDDNNLSAHKLRIPADYWISLDDINQKIKGDVNCEQ